MYSPPGVHVDAPGLNVNGFADALRPVGAASASVVKFPAQWFDHVGE